MRHPDEQCRNADSAISRDARSELTRPAFKFRQVLDRSEAHSRSQEIARQTRGPWLMLLALVLGLVSRIGLPWTAALVVAAAMIGLEANILRVASIGYGYDEDLLGWGTVALGVGQVVLLGLRSASLQGLGLGV